jgi:3-phosphoglycerate kinase
LGFYAEERGADQKVRSAFRSAQTLHSITDEDRIRATVLLESHLSRASQASGPQVMGPLFDLKRYHNNNLQRMKDDAVKFVVDKQ